MNNYKKTKRIASKVAEKYLNEISDMIDPSQELKRTLADPVNMIMQKDKVLHLHLDRDGDPSDFEKTHQFDELNFLVRYLIENGKKRKKDSF
jgi:hypothetical protein